MGQRLRSSLSYANVMSTLAVFLVIGGGTAVGALVVTSNSQVAQGTISGHKPPTGKHPNIIAGSVNGTDLATGSVTGGKLAPNAVNGTKVLDGSLAGGDIVTNSVTGTEINEQSLGTVPSAQVGFLGGIGRDTGGVFCNPEGAYIDCAITSINLPTTARVLVIGQVSAGLESGVTTGHGDCKLVTNTGDVSGTRIDFFLNTHPDVDGTGLTGVTDALGAGSHDFAVDCEDHTGGVNYGQVGITAVALSPF